MGKVKKFVKKQIAKQIGNQVENIIKRNVNYADPRALNYAGKFAEKTALRIMGEKTTPPAKYSSKTSKQKSTEFNIKIGGMEKVVREGLRGGNIGRAITNKNNNVRIEAKFTYRFGGSKKK